jgi:hypothetical protein
MCGKQNERLAFVLDFLVLFDQAKRTERKLPKERKTMNFFAWMQRTEGLANKLMLYRRLAPELVHKQTLAPA